MRKTSAPKIEITKEMPARNTDIRRFRSSTLRADGRNKRDGTALQPMRRPRTRDIPIDGLVNAKADTVGKAVAKYKSRVYNK